MGATTQSILTTGGDSIIVDIECILSNNLPTIVIVGFANKAVNEAKERVRGAFAASTLQLPRKRITINLAPADIPKADSGFDVAIAVSIMIASQHVPPLEHAQSQAMRPAFIGELGLDGDTRPVRGIIGKLLSGLSLGIDCFYISQTNLAQARLVPGITLIPVKSLRQLYEHLTKAQLIKPIKTGSGIAPAITTHAATNSQLDSIVGQEQAKRALEIAAAGGHNILLTGPPGTGKSMLAKALPSLLPPLSQHEILEVTHLHSLASHNYEKIMTTRPFRSPHHSASHVAVTGGGIGLKPGEISLAHRGVLLFDELPEFNRPTLEALRQPLEDRTIRLSRASDSVEYPASFILVATANPCPCGYAGEERCTCSGAQKLRYKQKISGPILDRIDLHCTVYEIQHQQLITPVNKHKNYNKLYTNITKARQLQEQRFASTKLNADMDNQDVIQLSKLSTEAKDTLNAAAERMALSARAYMRIIKVARTIADLAGSHTILETHLSEALAYRQPV